MIGMAATAAVQQQQQNQSNSHNLFDDKSLLDSHGEDSSPPETPSPIGMGMSHHLHSLPEEEIKAIQMKFSVAADV